MVLGISAQEVPVGNFTGTGMHGGQIFIRIKQELKGLPSQVTVKLASWEELEKVRPVLAESAADFGLDTQGLIKDRDYLLRANAQNPDKQLYTPH